MKHLLYSINILTAIVVLIIGIQSMEIFSLGSFGFLAWAVFPYFGTMLMMKYSKDILSSKIIFVCSLIITIGGIYLFVDAMYIHPNPQSALVFVVIPMYQWSILIGILLLMYVISKYRKNTMNQIK